ncbi:MAG: YkgJ family cysteine cluster protein [Deltaproteobacteria bacterium]|nr:YkgJ family cysteine cluster protein [Deltaproteobacteria bacterium]
MLLDCQRCGACCVNTPQNRREGYSAYVEIAQSDEILKKRDLMKKLVVLEAGVPHLRLDREGRCLALLGAIGRSVSCSIYHHRPSPCRRVEPGSRECLAHREAHGVS